MVCQSTVAVCAAGPSSVTWNVIVPPSSVAEASAIEASGGASSSRRVKSPEPSPIDALTGADMTTRYFSVSSSIVS
jgi:hypothetical protein